MSPPFGFALFYLRGVAPEYIPMSDIFRSAIPFLLLQVVGLLVCMQFPGVITWLPNIVYNQAASANWVWLGWPRRALFSAYFYESAYFSRDGFWFDDTATSVR